MENSGFYFHIEPSRLFLGVGLYNFSNNNINEYRESVIHYAYGKDLNDAIKKVQKNPGYQIGWKKFKKVPRGFDADHENADLLLYGGMGFQYEEQLPKEVFSSDIIEYTYNKFKDMAPIHDWLRKMTERLSLK